MGLVLISGTEADRRNLVKAADCNGVGRESPFINLYIFEKRALYADSPDFTRGWSRSIFQVGK